MDAIKMTTKAAYGEQQDGEMVLTFPIQRSDRWKAERLLENQQPALLVVAGEGLLAHHRCQVSELIIQLRQMKWINFHIDQGC